MKASLLRDNTFAIALLFCFSVHDFFYIPYLLSSGYSCFAQCCCPDIISRLIVILCHLMLNSAKSGGVKLNDVNYSGGF